MLSAGSDVIGDLNSEISGLADLCVPKDPRFELSPAAWDAAQLTVRAVARVPAGELIGRYQGYYVKSSEMSNERYNASVGGTGGEVTVDPCFGEDAPLPEWANSVTHRINEPPPGSAANCKWRIVKGSSPEIIAAVDIEPGDELLLYYGRGHSPLRDYEIAENCCWLETEDSYSSD